MGKNDYTVKFEKNVVCEHCVLYSDNLINGLCNIPWGPADVIVNCRCGNRILVWHKNFKPTGEE